MNELLKKFFKKPGAPVPNTNVASEIKFVILIKNFPIGYLQFLSGKWSFQYSEEFKNQDIYHRLVGFSDLEKTYVSDELWPFFKVRIPGLKQPLVKEIIKQEKINSGDEVHLLSFFGRKSMANPYILEPL